MTTGLMSTELSHKRVVFEVYAREVEVLLLAVSHDSRERPPYLKQIELRFLPNREQAIFLVRSHDELWLPIYEEH